MRGESRIWRRWVRRQRWLVGQLDPRSASKGLGLLPERFGAELHSGDMGGTECAAGVGSVAAGGQQGLGFAISGICRATPIRHGGDLTPLVRVRASFGSAHLCGAERVVGAERLWPIRGGVRAGQHRDRLRRHRSGRFDGGVLAFRVASSPGGFCPIGFDLEPEIGERDDRDHLR